jgi:hypothetical protein
MKTMDEERLPYDSAGHHMLVDGKCQLCGYASESDEESQMANKTPYGPKSKVDYADPGYQSDKTARYPIDTVEHVRAAIAYLSKPGNSAMYSKQQLRHMWNRIRAAAKKYGVEMSDTTGQMATEVEDVDQEALLASVAPLAPPAAWFTDPGFKAPTKLTIGDDGHVFGHLAQWKVCHVGIGKSCVMAPKSRTNYGLFHVGTVRCDNGTEVPIGKITLGTGHADPNWGIMPSREHYDNTGWAAAVVNVGEDRHGIWVNGALTTNMTEEKVAELRAASLSGDWRQVNGNLELIAALAVNSPGFPIYSERSGHAFSLAAVGIIGQEEDFDMEQGDEDFSANAQEYPADDVMNDASELSARLARWEQIDREFNEYNQDRRAAQLALIDEERKALAQKNGHNGVNAPGTPEAEGDELFAEYNARFRRLEG